jgi:hypothetical protein
MSNDENKPIAQRAGNGNTHRQATPEELKKHRADAPKVLAGIRAAHGKTMRRVTNMQNRPLYVDKG